MDHHQHIMYSGYYTVMMNYAKLSHQLKVYSP